MIKEYKGFFYGNNEEKEYYEGGAHFSYQQLVMKLLQLQKDNKHEEHTNNKHVLHSDNQSKTKRYIKCKKLLLETCLPLKVDTKSKGIRLLQKEEISHKDNINDDKNNINHKKSNSFTKGILSSRNHQHNNNNNNILQHHHTQQLKQQMQPLKLTLTLSKQKSSLNQNKSHIQNTYNNNSNEHVLPKLNLKYPQQSEGNVNANNKSENHLNLNLFNKGNHTSRNRNVLNHHNHNNTKNGPINSLKFFSIDDKQFKNAMKGYNSNVPITERKRSSNKKSNPKEMYKLNLKEYKTYHNKYFS